MSHEKMSQSGRTRADDIAQQMNVVPNVPSVDTEYVAKILAEEASRRKRSYESIGIAAYTRPLPSTAPKEVNKTFLSNTIRGVDSHNRREQIDDCWRAHRLNARLDARHGCRLDNRKRSREGNRRESSSGRSSDFNESGKGRVHINVFDDDVQNERAYWARLKENKRKVEDLAQNISASSDSPSRITRIIHDATSQHGPGLDEEERSRKKRKKDNKDSRKKKHKREKKSKKKSKHKSSVKGDQHSTESGTDDGVS